MIYCGVAGAAVFVRNTLGEVGFVTALSPARYKARLFNTSAELLQVVYGGTTWYGALVLTPLQKGTAAFRPFVRNLARNFEVRFLAHLSFRSLLVCIEQT